jgi:hypothetical protein
MLPLAQMGGVETFHRRDAFARRMPNETGSQGELDKADDAIASAERRIADQLILIQRLRERDEDTSDAVKLLLSMREALHRLRAHRERVFAQARRRVGDKPKALS